jgi:inosine-uridine nucleoside N-ribohydrolase
VTRRVRATRPDLDRMAQGGPASQTCAALITAYFDGTRNMTQVAESRPLHDPCVMLLAAHPDLFGIDPLHLSIDCGPAPDAGALTPGAGHPVRVALRVDGPAALATLIAGLA